MTDETAVAERRCLIATFPCGCIGAVESLTHATAREQADFFREHTEDGALVENVTHDEYNRRGGLSLCKHEPQWGGVESKYGYCDRCGKRVRKNVNKPGLRKHVLFAGITCSQEPRTKAVG